VRATTSFFRNQEWDFAPHERSPLPGAPATPDHPFTRRIGYATLSETLRLATNRYNDGYAPYLDQLDAQRGLLAAQLIAIQIATDRLNTMVTLYQALGGGWQHPVGDQPFYKATAWTQP
jgi:hypothetical protein